MRSEEEITNLILSIAKENENIRAVLLNGSRANPKIKKDNFRDFDIVYIVRNLYDFLADHSWINVFGERIILQMPDQMALGEKDKLSFHYLMLFKDFNRIDLRLFPIEEFEKQFEKDSLTIVLLDKDKLFKNIPEPDDSDYLISPPTQKKFEDCCNEFWWVSTCVAKGLYRKDITYAKEMLEIPVRAMFFKIIEWYIGINKDFSVSFGKAGKFMKENVSPELYERILATYPDAMAENIWKCLFTMTDVFKELAAEIAFTLNFRYDRVEEENVINYLNAVYKMTKEEK